ncbi:MAG: hypothetical protein M1834_005456 [Cirrosporium novae-zelandiae]|nr:MAG: hypothetical protein M1834_005456 [Cirrosporium novae-zelandiae]
MATTITRRNGNGSGRPDQLESLYPTSNPKDVLAPYWARAVTDREMLNQTLIKIANQFLDLDEFMLNALMKYYSDSDKKLFASEHINNSKGLKLLQEEIKDIHDGRYGFDQDYLKNKMRSGFIIANLDKSKLENYLAHAAAEDRGVIDSETWDIIDRKLSSIDTIYDSPKFQHIRHEGDMTWLKTWRKIKIARRRIEKAYEKHSSEVIGRQARNVYWATTLTALTVITSFACTVPFFLGWQYSGHAPGTNKEANFWFLVQSFMMQALALGTMTLPIWQGANPHGQDRFWIWAWVIAAAVCTGLELPLYLYTPTEYSSLAAFAAAIAQAFVAIHVSLAATPKNEAQKQKNV